MDEKELEGMWRDFGKAVIYTDDVDKFLAHKPKNEIREKRFKAYVQGRIDERNKQTVSMEEEKFPYKEVGEEFEWNGKRLRVALSPDNTCTACDLTECSKIIGYRCNRYSRADHTSVVYVDIT